MERVAVFLLAAVPTISLVAVVLLCCGSFTAQRALVIGIPLAIWLAWPLLLSKSDFESRWPPRARRSLVLLLLVASLLRWPPALHLESTSDQAVYLAMAAHFVENGTLDVTDDVRDSLTSPDAIARFDRNNTSGVYQPGIYLDLARPGHYVFQFYHVHPLWMAIFGSVLGLDQAVWSQIFFGLISLFFAALIAERFSGDWRTGIAFAALLACLPLHIFFSKFPISEMTMLALAFMTVYALLRSSDCQHEPAQARWLVLTALVFAAMFLTRISGFVYLPVVYLAALLCHASIEHDRLRKRWGLFWLSVVACYFGSVIYGLTFSASYSQSIYLMHFGPMLAWVPWILVACAVIAALPFAILRDDAGRARLRNWLQFAWFHGQRWIPLLLLVLLVLGAVRVGLLAFTDYYRGSDWYDQTWQMSHAGTDAILRSALIVAAENIGPVLVLLLPFALWKPGVSAPRALLVTMVLAMIAYSALLQWFLPFQYYYSRYLLSELVPFTLLLLVLRGADWWRVAARRRWIAAGLALTGVYFAWYAWPLIGLREAHGAESSLTRIANEVDPSSVLLVDEEGIDFASQFVTPLRMWFGMNVYSVHDFAEIPVIVQDLKRAGAQNILMLSGRDGIPRLFAYDMRVHIEQTRMERSPYIPRRSDLDVADLVLSRLDDGAFAGMLLTSGPGLGLADLPRGCCLGFEADGIWTRAHSSIRRLALPRGSWQRLVITMRGYRPDYTQANLVVHANGKQLHLEKADGPTFEFSLGPIEGPTPLELELDTGTFVPRELGLNDDSRHLGLDIGTLHIN